MSKRATNILDELEADESAEAGAQFLGIAARYYAHTRNGRGQVSTPLTPREIALRFAEPMPMYGCPISEVVEWIEREIFTDANQLCYPMYMGHQLCAPLPEAPIRDSAAFNARGAPMFSSSGSRFSGAVRDDNESENFYGTPDGAPHRD